MLFSSIYFHFYCMFCLIFSTGIATDPNAISKYRAGFNDCASEIARYLDTVNGGNPQLKARVMNYLGNSLLQFPVIPVYQGVVSPYQVQMTSPVTSQCYPSTGYPPITPSGVVTSPYPHQYPVPSHISSCDVYKSLPQTNSPIKVEPSDIGLISPRSSSHTTSPERRVPSPCDSDSGLSDISTTVPQDENGNYTHFTGSSQQSRLDNESQNYAHVQSTDSRKRSYSDERTSPKRKEFPYESCPPKKRVKCENNANSEIKPEPPRDVPAHDPMWRPW